jgi:subtilisin family serine protease
MAVTATDASDRLFNNANQGKYITVAAPGVDILVPAPNGALQFTTGTSVAAANVSGVAALLIAKNHRLRRRKFAQSWLGQPSISDSGVSIRNSEPALSIRSRPLNG